MGLSWVSMIKPKQDAGTFGLGRLESCHTLLSELPLHDPNKVVLVFIHTSLI